MSHSLEQTKKKLDAISPTHCIVKWKHASVYLAAGTVKSCCHNYFSSKLSSFDDPQLAFHDTQKDQKIRQKLLEGKKPKECDFCWKNEQTGSYSDRLYWSSLPFMDEFAEEVAEHRSPEVLNPSWLELNFSPKCQLKCSYCGPEVSTSWKAEVDEFGPYPTQPSFGSTSYLSLQQRSPYDDRVPPQFFEAFWQWFEDVYYGLVQLTLTGGEPLLAKEYQKLIDWINENPNANMQLTIHSNLSFGSKTWEKFVRQFKQLVYEKKIKQIFLHPSLDGWGEPAEYIRHGLNLEYLKQNVETYLQAKVGNLVFNCTLNILSLPSLKMYWQYIGELKRKYSDIYLSTTTEPLIFPEFMRISLLPSKYVKYLDNTIEYVESQGTLFSDHEKEGLQRAKKLLISGEDKLFIEKNRKNFYIYFSEYDRRKKRNFCKTFPDLEEFWMNCKLVHDKESFLEKIYF